MSLFSVVTPEGGDFELYFDASADIAVSDVVRMLGKADAKARYGGQFGLPVIHAKAPATVPKEGLQELTKVPVSVD